MGVDRQEVSRCCTKSEVQLHTVDEAHKRREPPLLWYIVQISLKLQEVAIGLQKGLVSSRILFFFSKKKRRITNRQVWMSLNESECPIDSLRKCRRHLPVYRTRYNQCEPPLYLQQCLCTYWTEIRRFSSKFLLPASSCRKVMFSQACVSHLFRVG